MSFNPITPFKYRLIYGFCQFLEHFLGKKRGLLITKRIRKFIYHKLYLYLKTKPANLEIEVKRIPYNSSVKEIKKLINKRIPFVIEKGAENWECVNKWSFDYLSKNYGDDDILIHDFTTPENPSHKTKLKNLIFDLDNKTSNYFRFYPFLEKHPERAKDIKFNWIYNIIGKKFIFQTIQLFIGPDKSYTSLHNAYANNFFIQIAGEKNWVLYHWKDTMIIDPDPVLKNYRGVPRRKNNEGFNPFENDYEKPFELYKYLPKYKVRLTSGDIFYNPPYVWHSVKNKEKNIGFGYRWVSLKHSFITSPLYFALDVFTKNPTFFNTMRETKKDFNKFNIQNIKKENT